MKKYLLIIPLLFLFVGNAKADQLNNLTSASLNTSNPTFDQYNSGDWVVNYTQATTDQSQGISVMLFDNSGNPLTPNPQSQGNNIPDPATSPMNGFNLYSSYITNWNGDYTALVFIINGDLFDVSNCDNLTDCETYLTGIGTNNFALPFTAVSTPTVTSITPSNSGDWTTFTIKYVNYNFISDYSCSGGGGNGLRAILFKQNGVQATPGNYNGESCGTLTVTPAYVSTINTYWNNDTFVGSVIPNSGFYFVTLGNGGNDYTIDNSTTLSELQTQSLTVNNGGIDSDFHVSNLFSYQAPCTAGSSLSSSTLGCAVDQVNGGFTGYMFTLASHYWPWVMGAGVVGVVWHFGLGAINMLF